jgi:hypothetical protein
MSSEKDAGALFDELTGTAQPEAATPEVEVTPEPEVAATPEPEAQPEPKAFDPSTLPEEARSYYDRELKAREERLKTLEGEYKALKGKVPGLQRELARYQQQRPAQPQRAPAAGNATTENTKADATLASAEWDRVKQEWPEVAGPLEKLITSQKAEHATELEGYRKALAEVQGRLDSILPNVERVTEYTSRLEAQEARKSVLDQHSDFNDHVKVGYDEETDEAWLQDPSPQLKEYLDSRNPMRRTELVDSLLSTDPEKVAGAMSEFKEWLGLKYPKGEQKKPEPSARLRQSVSAPVKGRGASAVNAEAFTDPGDYFDALQSGA